MNSLKKGLILITLLFFLNNLSAQAPNRFALGIEIGTVASSDLNSNGFLLNIEPKYKIIENGFIGLRFGVSIGSRGKNEANDMQFNIESMSGSGALSIVPTFDYYFNDNKFRPFSGIGIGYYSFNDLDVIRTDSVTSIQEQFKGKVNSQIGLLLRSGFELAKFRLTLEYNLISKVDIEAPDAQIIGKVSEGYWGLSIGFRIGGG